jgi:hypothetical protein
MSRMAEKVRVPDARAQAREARRWQCETCETFIEDHRDGARNCWRCAQYWEDVAAGLFDD